VRPPPDPLAAARGFDLEAAPVEAAPLGNGHIHDTFLVGCGAGSRTHRYVLQRLNRTVFPDPDLVMANIARVLDHVHARLGPERAVGEALTLVPARDGRPSLRDAVGETWRAYLFVADASSHDEPRTPGDAYQAARAFATFQRLLGDLPAPPLAATIQGFHDTPARLAALERAVATDRAKRAGGARAEVDFALANAGLADALVSLQRRGLLAERVVHNDTKLNNVLLDDATGRAVCVIDLDTVMPGLALHDFGDLVRSAAGAAAEDAPEYSRHVVVPERFAAIARGFVEGLGGELSTLERASLVLAARVMTFECGIRFLADHLDGDRYFRVHRPDHNLDRCRTQFALLRSLAEREDELLGLVETEEDGP
jgi:Ser/Thr protein kinase RdoA (MazF antagonist)